MEIYKNLDLEDLDSEIWKDIEEFPDYQISNLGRVKSFKRKDIIILKQKEDNNGYLHICLCKYGKKETKPIHILIYEAFYEKLREFECIHHLDENKKNNICDNLNKMTKSEHSVFHNYGENNSMFGIHRYGKDHPNFGTKRPGEKSGNHKLTEKDIIEIRNSNLTQKEIAEIFGVDQSTISKIKSNKNWKYLKNEDKK